MGRSGIGILIILGKQVLQHPLRVIQERFGDEIVIGVAIGDLANPILRELVQGCPRIGQENRRVRRDQELRMPWETLNKSAFVIPATARAWSTREQRSWRASAPDSIANNHIAPCFRWVAA
jgi:hypothetical protein